MTAERVFTREDRAGAWATGIVMLAAYAWTLAPNLTLQDSGELAVASYYAGVPHPPGYPVWTVYTWIFTLLLPISNVAWRVAVSSAVAGAAACALVALVTSRVTASMIQGLPRGGAEAGREQRAIPWVAGFVAGTLLGFNGFMWSQAVIVEVYTLSALSFMAVLALVLRWVYRPDSFGSLLWAFFLFGICFTNHQTLLVAAMGLEALICAARPALGRDLLAANGAVYLLGLIFKSLGGLVLLTSNPPLLMIYHAVGLGSLAGAVWMWRRSGAILTEWKRVLGLGGAWLGGASFYLLMPVFSATNPPMNWGYARTWEGFLHAVTRGQYAQATPTQSLGQFGEQWLSYLEGALEEFGGASLLFAAIPFVLWKQWGRRDRGWLLGMAAVFGCLAVLLLILLNPPPGRQSRELNKVFFTASHMVLAIWIGCGLGAVVALLSGQYEQYRRPALYGSAVAAGMAVYGVAHPSSRHLLAQMAVWWGVLAAFSWIGLFLMVRRRCPSWALLGLFGLLPVQSVLSHWSDNEQRGHLFGYWYGHDMFAPPFELYPDMARDAILFGGTDPGRFNPTYMIFCESFLPPAKKPLDPTFDRRDVYIITQNALADGTYLNYIRAHYNRSAQRDLPFFGEMLRTERERQAGRTNVWARMARPLDASIAAFGGWIEEKRRRRGVYPAAEIEIPANTDLKEKVDAFVADMWARAQRGEFGEVTDLNKVINRPGGVMAVNGEMSRLIFDRNPEREFYVEESYPIEWMYPHLTPHGIIMKLNREPVVEITGEMAARDREFWRRYAARLSGDWITEQTTVEELCDFNLRVYLSRDFEGFRGDRKFVRDATAQKAFSGLRNAIAGLYYWRYLNATDPDVKERMRREAEFAYKQAVAFCPYNGQAVMRYGEILMSSGRVEDARLLVATGLEFDPDDALFQSLWQHLEQLRVQELGTGAHKIEVDKPRTNGLK